MRNQLDFQKKYATRFVKDRRKIGKTLHLNLLSRANGFCKDFLFVSAFRAKYITRGWQPRIYERGITH